MSKVLEASCVGNVVTCEGLVLDGAEILSEGVGDSEGIVLIDGEKIYYIAKTTPDVADTIEKVAEMLTSIKLILTSIGSGMTGPTTAPPGTLVADLLALQLKITALETLGSNLK